MSVVTGQDPVTLELRNTPRQKKQTEGGTRTYHSCLCQKRTKIEIGSQPTMCQVHTDAYISLLVPGKIDYLVNHLPPRKDYHVYITRSTYCYVYARQTRVN